MKVRLHESFTEDDFDFEPLSFSEAADSIQKYFHIDSDTAYTIAEWYMNEGGLDGYDEGDGDAFARYVDSDLPDMLEAADYNSQQRVCAALIKGGVYDGFDFTYSDEDEDF